MGPLAGPGAQTTAAPELCGPRPSLRDHPLSRRRVQSARLGGQVHFPLAQ
jgi:hypothetical protein